MQSSVVICAGKSLTFYGIKKAVGLFFLQKFRDSCHPVLLWRTQNNLSQLLEPIQDIRETNQISIRQATGYPPPTKQIATLVNSYVLQQSREVPHSHENQKPPSCTLAVAASSRSKQPIETRVLHWSRKRWTAPASFSLLSVVEEDSLCRQDDFLGRSSRRWTALLRQRKLEEIMRAPFRSKQYCD